jgi:POLQ-like helicase
MSSRSLAYTWPYPRHKDFEKHLRKAAETWFASNGYPVNPKMPYILDKWSNWPHNIILPEVADYIIKERAKRATVKGFPLHRYVHHGLSSQAMLFNLIGPLTINQDLSPLKRTFDDNNISWPEGEMKAYLEFEDRKVFNEDTGQPTSIDLIIQDGTGSPKIVIEAKLVEREFGGCSVFAAGDCDGRNPAGNFSLCYLHHIGRKYWELLEKHGFLEGSIGKDAACILTVYYQFFREVLFAFEYNSTFVLLYDERNPTFMCDGPYGKRGLMPFLISLVPKKLHGQAKMLSIQQVVMSIKSSTNLEWIQEFENKYGLIVSDETM